MPVRQYVYFALTSRLITPGEITAALGIEPDETRVHNPRRLPVDPERPFSQSWKVVCREPGLRVDEQLAHVLDRLEPRTERIAELIRRFDTGDAEQEQEQEQSLQAVLEVVRYFGDGEPRTEPGPHANEERPNLFGWWLDRRAIAFLAATGAVLDVDEYDLTD
ncbi:DUF4279 domain-containing protein [Streptomyces zaomyceticus]|uniref:DUF4279 domain-containing protein n=1 Tax=Streptomyces zaomyceticus TaxID=68286 RepID=UPI003651D5EA